MIDCNKCGVENCMFNALIPKESCEMYKEKEKVSDENASLLSFICIKHNISIEDMSATVTEWEQKHLCVKCN